MALNQAAATAQIANDDRIALFDLQRQRTRLETDIKRRMDAVLQHGQFILGPEVDELEERLASYSAARHAIAVSSGRDALMIGLMGLGVGPGDAVFVPAFTFAATAGAVVSVGATPVFVDVEPETFNMSVTDLADAISDVAREAKLAPKVVMPVDLYGLPADYPQLEAVAEQHGLTVFADAAQSFGSALNGRRAGALAPISATSFYPTKPLGCYGDGGAILTEDDGIADVVRMIRSHGRAGTGDEAHVLGLTGRLDTLQAAVLLSKLEVFDDELIRRREIASRYDDALGEVVAITETPQGFESAYALYTIRVQDRDRVRADLEKVGIGSGLFYRLALHDHPAFAGVNQRSLPASEQAALDVLSLPIHADLTNGEVERVIEAVRAAV